MIITQEKLNSWYEHKSNKEMYIEAWGESEDNPYKENVEDPQKDLVRETLETLREN